MFLHLNFEELIKVPDFDWFESCLKKPENVASNLFYYEISSWPEYLFLLKLCLNK